MEFSITAADQKPQDDFARVECFRARVSGKSKPSFTDMALIVVWQTCVDDDPTTEHQHGYPGNAYRVSKAFVNAATGILGRNHPDVTVNSCCPGWVNTDMGRLVGSPTKSPSKSGTASSYYTFHAKGL